jgi:hypothetical protein
MSDQPLHLKALDWAKQNPSYVLAGGLSVLIIAAAIGVTSQSRPTKEVHSRPIGTAPAQQSISKEELLNEGGDKATSQLSTAVNAISDRSSEAIGSLLQTRCLRWQRAWLDDKERTRKSAHRVYTEQLDLQAKQLIETPGDRLDLQSQRLVEIVALNFALSVGCRQSSLLVKTPRDIGTSDDARNGALLTAIQEAQTQAVLIDASDAGEQEIAAREAQESLDRHRNLPVLNPMGGQP